MNNHGSSIFGCLVNHRPGRAVGYNGLRQANDDFLKAVIRYSHFSELHLFLAQTDMASFKELWSEYLASYGSDKNIRLLPVQRLPEYMEKCHYAVFHSGDPFISDLASLREHHASILFPITGRAHTLSNDCRLSRMRDLILSPVKICDAVLCSSMAQSLVMKRLLASASASISDVLSVAIPYKGQVELLPLGIEPEGSRGTGREEARTALGYTSHRSVILCLGRLSAADKMDLHPLLFALNDLQETGRARDFLLVIAGNGDASGEYVRSLLKKAYELNLEDQIRFELTVNDDRKALLLKAADVFVSISDNTQESFGLAPLEAMKAGLPLVLSDWNGYRDLVEEGENGFLVETVSADKDALSRSAGLLHSLHARLIEAQGTVVDVEALARALENLLNDEQLRRHLGMAGRLRVKERFAWPVLMEHYHELVSHLNTEAARINHRPGRPVGMSFRNAFGHYATTELSENTRLQATDRGIRVLLQSENGFFFSELNYVLDKDLVRSVISAAIESLTVAEMRKKLPELDHPEFVLLWMMKYQLLRCDRDKPGLLARRAYLPEFSDDEDVHAALGDQITFPEEKRSVFILPILAQCLAVVTDSISKLDTSDGELLANLSGELVALLDERLLQAIAWYGSERSITAYGEIIQQLENEGGLDRLRQLYPLWLRNSRKEVFRFLRSVKTLFRRLDFDLDSINQEFSGGWRRKAGGVVTLDYPKCNTCWSVVILSLDNGERLVYKSRDLRIDQLLLGSTGSAAVKINEWLGDFPGLGTYGVIPARELNNGRECWYGYSQYISSSPEGLTFSPEEAARYHQHLGVILGFSLLMGLADLHHLNIIGHDGVPCLVDVETALHADVFRSLERELHNPEAGFMRGVDQSSLAQTGLRNLWESFHTTRVNNCSVRLVNGELLKAEPLQWLPAANNLLSVGKRHSLDGIHPTVSGMYLTELMEGFERLLDVVAGHQDEWMDLLHQAAGLGLRYQPQLNLNDARKQLRDLYVSPVFQVLPDDRLDEYFGRIAKRITVAGEVGQRWLDEGWKEPLGDLSDVMAKGWLEMSQPVFVRLPEETGVFVRGLDGDHQLVSGEPYFQGISLKRLRVLRVFWLMM